MILIETYGNTLNGKVWCSPVPDVGVVCEALLQEGGIQQRELSRQHLPLRRAPGSDRTYRTLRKMYEIFGVEDISEFVWDEKI